MLKSIAENLWSNEGIVRLPGGARMPVRMSVVRLSGGGLVLISPIALSDQLTSELSALGPVEHIVAPNRLHHLFLADCMARFPDAQVHGAPGLAAKRPDVRFQHTLGVETATFDSELHALLIAGAPSISEVVLFHVPTRTLLVTDLVFHLRQSYGWMSALIFTLMGVRGRLAQSRAWRFVIEDRQAVASSVDRLLSLPFERLVPAHGEIVEGEARTALARALRSTQPSVPLLAVARRTG
jgi:hypothetical protein